MRALHYLRLSSRGTNALLVAYATVSLAGLALLSVGHDGLPQALHWQQDVVETDYHWLSCNDVSDGSCGAVRAWYLTQPTTSWAAARNRTAHVRDYTNTHPAPVECPDNQCPPPATFVFKCVYHPEDPTTVYLPDASDYKVATAALLLLLLSACAVSWFALLVYIIMFRSRGLVKSILRNYGDAGGNAPTPRATPMLLDVVAETGTTTPTIRASVVSGHDCVDALQVELPPDWAHAFEVLPVQLDVLSRLSVPHASVAGDVEAAHTPAPVVNEPQEVVLFGYVAHGMSVRAMLIRPMFLLGVFMVIGMGYMMSLSWTFIAATLLVQLPVPMLLAPGALLSPKVGPARRSVLLTNRRIVTTGTWDPVTQAQLSWLNMFRQVVVEERTLEEIVTQWRSAHAAGTMPQRVAPGWTCHALALGTGSPDTPADRDAARTDNAADHVQVLCHGSTATVLFHQALRGTENRPRLVYTGVVLPLAEARQLAQLLRQHLRAQFDRTVSQNGKAAKLVDTKAVGDVVPAAPGSAGAGARDAELAAVTSEEPPAPRR